MGVASAMLPMEEGVSLRLGHAAGCAHRMRCIEKLVELATIGAINRTVVLPGKLSRRSAPRFLPMPHRQPIRISPIVEIGKIQAEIEQTMLNRARR
jgi:hypothetical protein